MFEVVDASRSLFLAELHGGRVAAILERLQGPRESRADVTLYQAVPKGKHMDLVVEKATEVGVNTIVPLVTERSVVRPEGQAKVERWRRLSRAAASQSLQIRVPQVREPVSFEQALIEAGDGSVLLHNEPGLPTLEEAVHGTAARLFIGPEGGWSDTEKHRAADSGVSMAQLGPYRLRSETAGIVATARTVAALQRFENSE
ncbi:hypothetical protein BH23ACT11_BH23ACT11_25880 [soil metagenome]